MLPHIIIKKLISIFKTEKTMEIITKAIVNIILIIVEIFRNHDNSNLLNDSNSIGNQSIKYTVIRLSKILKNIINILISTIFIFII